MRCTTVLSSEGPPPLVCNAINIKIARLRAMITDIELAWMRCTTVLSSGAPSPRSAVVPPCSHGCFSASRAVGRLLGSLQAISNNSGLQQPQGLLGKERAVSWSAARPASRCQAACSSCYPRRLCRSSKARALVQELLDEVLRFIGDVNPCRACHFGLLRKDRLAAKQEQIKLQYIAQHSFASSEMSTRRSPSVWAAEQGSPCCRSKQRIAVPAPPNRIGMCTLFQPDNLLFALGLQSLETTRCRLRRHKGVEVGDLLDAGDSGGARVLPVIKRQVAGQQLVAHHACRPHVRRRPHLALEHLWRHVPFGRK